MRVTFQSQAKTIRDNLEQTVNQLQLLQKQVSSGRRLERVSDDVTSGARAMHARKSLALNEQFLRNMQAARDWLTASDSALSSVHEALHRAHELAVKGANDTNEPQDRIAIAREVDQLLQHVVHQANTPLGGRHIFAGFKVLNAPYPDARDNLTTADLTAPGAYRGDNNSIVVDLTQDSSIIINVSGEQTFASTFSALITLRDALNTNNGTAIRDAIPLIATALDNILNTRTTLGTKINRIDFFTTVSREEQLELTKARSREEDVDFAAAITKLTSADQLYRAALNAAGMTGHVSLFDFLRR